MTTAALIPVRDRLEDLIDSWLPEYEEVVERRRWRSWLNEQQPLEYKGRSLKFRPFPGEHAEKAQSWIRFFHALNKASDRGEQLLLVFGGGLTYRDGALIRFIRRQEQGEAALVDIYREFGALLPAEALRESLGKLEKLGYLESKEDRVRLTFRGCYVYL